MNGTYNITELTNLWTGLYCQFPDLYLHVGVSSHDQEGKGYVLYTHLYCSKYFTLIASILQITLVAHTALIMWSQHLYLEEWTACN